MYFFCHISRIRRGTPFQSCYVDWYPLKNLGYVEAEDYYDYPAANLVPFNMSGKVYDYT